MTRDQIGRMTAGQAVEAFQDLLAAMSEESLREALPGCNRRDREILLEVLQDLENENAEEVSRG